MAGYLEHILLAFENHAETGFVPLSPGETYIALLAVLFHDYGKLVPEELAGGMTHGQCSKAQLEKHHAKLGIHARAVAQIVGEIVACHGFEPPSPEDYAEGKWGVGGTATAIARLSEITLDSVGHVRVPLLAALLCLADQMDAGYTRSVPEYMTEEKGGVIGHFRRHIRGLSVDARTRMVKTAMTLAEADPPEDGNKILYQAFDNRRAKKGEKKPIEDRLFNGPDPSAEVECPSLPLPTHVATQWLPRDYEQESKRAEKNRFMYLASRLVRLERKPVGGTGASAPGIYMPPFGPHAIAFANMWDNTWLFLQVVPVLRRYGILLDSWLVEIDGGLFKHDGCKTFEPVLSKKLLEDTANAMWSLATSIFASTSFTYEDVAAYLGDPAVWRVKVACRRVAAMINSSASRGADQPAPWTGTDRWHWHAVSDQKTPRCRYFACGTVVEAIIKKELKDPHVLQ